MPRWPGEPWRNCPARPRPCRCALTTLTTHTALLCRALARVGSDAPDSGAGGNADLGHERGNPFVAVEAMRAPIRTTSGVARRGTDALALPGLVLDLVAGRLDRLSGHSQEWLPWPRSSGAASDFTLLHSASGMDERDAAAAVEEMVRRTCSGRGEPAGLHP